MFHHPTPDTGITAPNDATIAPNTQARQTWKFRFAMLHQVGHEHGQQDCSEPVAASFVGRARMYQPKPSRVREHGHAWLISPHLDCDPTCLVHSGHFDCYNCSNRNRSKLCQVWPPSDQPDVGRTLDIFGKSSTDLRLKLLEGARIQPNSNRNWPNPDPPRK